MLKEKHGLEIFWTGSLLTIDLHPCERRELATRRRMVRLPPDDINSAV